MGLLSSFSGKDQKRAASKAAKNLLQSNAAAQQAEQAGYTRSLAAIDPTTAATQSWLTQGRDQVLGAYGNAYNTAQGSLTGGRDQALGALGTAYGTARGDVANSLGAQLAAIQQANQYGQGLYQPYITAGNAGLGRVTAMTTPGDTSFQADPGYQFRVQQGSEGIQNSAAGQGGVLGGNTLKALENYRQGLASSEFGNVYNRNLGLAQMGLGASGSAANLGQWAGGATAGANQWGGGQNANLAQWLGTGQGNLYNQTGQNLANLAQQYGTQQAGTLGNYYGANADLTQQSAQQRQALDLAQALAQANYATGAGNIQAQREVSQGNASAQGASNVLGLLGTLGGAGLGAYGALGGKGGLAGLGSSIGGLLGYGSTAGSTPAAGYGFGGTDFLRGIGSANPYLTGSIYS